MDSDWPTFTQNPLQCIANHVWMSTPLYSHLFGISRTSSKWRDCQSSRNEGFWADESINAFTTCPRRKDYNFRKEEISIYNTPLFKSFLLFQFNHTFLESFFLILSSKSFCLNSWGFIYWKKLRYLIWMKYISSKPFSFPLGLVLIHEIVLMIDMNLSNFSWDIFFPRIFSFLLICRVMT